MKNILIAFAILFSASLQGQKYVQQFTKDDGAKIAISLQDIAFVMPSGNNGGSVLITGPSAKAVYVQDTLQNIIDSSGTMLVALVESYKLNGKDAVRNIGLSKQHARELIPSGASQTKVKLASPQMTVIINDDFEAVSSLLCAASGGGGGSSGPGGIYGGSDSIPLYTRATVIPDEDYLQPEFSIGVIPEWDSDNGEYLFGDALSYYWMEVSPFTKESIVLNAAKSFDTISNPTVWERLNYIQLSEFDGITLDLTYNEQPDDSGYASSAGLAISTDDGGSSDYFASGELFCESRDNSTGEVREASIAFGTEYDHIDGIKIEHHTTYDAQSYYSNLSVSQAFAGLSVSDSDLGIASSVGVNINRVVISAETNRIASFKDNSIYLGPETETAAHSIKWGEGDPNTVVTANPGSFYVNTLGGAGATFWVKESGTGNTGWVAK